jgi:Ca2+-binding RTX toxin-like protein
LVLNDINGFSDIFVKDLTTGVVLRVSTGAGGTEGNLFSRDPKFSPDGNFVAFSSFATTLVPGDTPGSDIFVKNLNTGSITKISVSATGNPGDGGSQVPVFSPDGTKISFESSATNLLDGQTLTNDAHLYMKDLITGAVTLLSANAAGEELSGISFGGQFSADGNSVLVTNSSITGQTRSYIKNLITGQLTDIATLAGLPAGTQTYATEFSPDGTGISFYAYTGGIAQSYYFVKQELGSGADSFNGGTGTDTVSYQSALQSVTVDLIDGTGQSNDGDAFGDTYTSVEKFLLSKHDDTFVGSGGADVVNGGLGNDTLSGGLADDMIEGNGGSDTLDGGGNTSAGDTLSYSSSGSGVTVNIGANTASGGDAAGDIVWNFENLTGSGFGDTLTGSAGNNTLSGGAGSDTLSGGAGDDRLMIDARTAGDIDVGSGGVGQDTIDLSGMASAVWVDLQYTSMEVWTSGVSTANGSNANTQVVNLDSVENIIGTSGSDTVLGDGKDNSYKFTGNAVGTPDTFVGRGGTDTVDVSSLSSVWVDLSRPIYYANIFTSGTSQSYGNNANTAVVNLSDVENVIGTKGTDTIIGNASDNTFVSNGVASVGVDYFNGAAGSDTIDLSSLNYTGAVWVDLTYAGVQVWLSNNITSAYRYNANTAIATLVGVENVVGTSGTDQFYGDGTNNTYVYNGKAAGTSEVIDGRGGSDTFDGSASDTSLWIDLAYTAMEVWSVGTTVQSTGANANTAIADLTSIENITGSQYADTLLGNAGNNRIDSGFGNDVIYGRGGSDRFVFSFDVISQQGSGVDTIVDFAAGAGLVDVIELQGYGAALDSLAEILAAATDTATGVQIQLTANDTLTLNGLTKSQLVADDFGFT